MAHAVRIATLCLLASATVAQLDLGSAEQATSDCRQCPNPIGDIKALACAVDWISKLRILNKTTTTIDGETVDAYTLEHLDILKGTLEIPSLLIVPNGPCGLVLNADPNPSSTRSIKDFLARSLIFSVMSLIFSQLLILGWLEMEVFSDIFLVPMEILFLMV
ncbi:unnamed protein product, partial [Mesorhabditis spiculigera]